MARNSLARACQAKNLFALQSFPHQSERKSMIRLLNDRKNPAGAGIFSERRINRFSGMMRVSEPFPPAVPLIWLRPDHRSYYVNSVNGIVYIRKLFPYVGIIK
jgi:hypothetical protein